MGLEKVLATLVLQYMKILSSAYNDCYAFILLFLIDALLPSEPHFQTILKRSFESFLVMLVADEHIHKTMPSLAKDKRDENNWK